MELTYSNNSVSWSYQFQSGDKLIFLATECRRERTGYHARIAILKNDKPLAYDTFNTARREERTRLAKQAFNSLTSTNQAEYKLINLNADLDMFCLQLPTFLEEQQFTVDLFNVDGRIDDLNFILTPYILEGAGTILFSPPGSGKTYCGMTMAVSIGAGLQDFWQIQKHPILYINLERSRDSMKRRLQMICNALNVKGHNHNVYMLNARGKSVSTIHKFTKKFIDGHPEAIGFLDSISRSGYGSMIDDDVANKIIDVLNELFKTWFAIGHTNRAKGSDHVFGSQMFDAGEDIGILLSSEHRNNTLGISLDVKKSNDTNFPPMQFLAYEFSDPDDDGNSVLLDIRKAREFEFPELSALKEPGNADKVRNYISLMGEATVSMIAENTGIVRSHVYRYLTRDNDIIVSRKTGREVWYKPLS